MTQKIRNSNLELYRIITMLAIVAHHYVANSGLMGGAVSEYEFNSRNLFFLLFGMWGMTGINCFVLITGYFMRQWLWKDTVDCVGHYNDTYYYLYAPAAVLCIFVVCSFIDYIRIHTVEKWVFNWIQRNTSLR